MTHGGIVVAIGFLVMLGACVRANLTCKQQVIAPFNHSIDRFRKLMLGGEGLRIMTDGGGVLINNDESNEQLAIGQLSQDVMQLIHLVTQPTRYTLLMNMSAHPKQSPTLDELVYLHPNKGKTTVLEHLDTLVEWGLVEKLVIPTGKRSRSLPSTFYRLSDVGREFLAAYGLYAADERELQQRYQELPKTDKVIRYEEAPREKAEVDDSGVDKCKAAQVKAAVNAASSREEKDPDEDDHSIWETVSSALGNLIDQDEKQSRTRGNPPGDDSKGVLNISSSAESESESGSRREVQR